MDLFSRLSHSNTAAVVKVNWKALFVAMTDKIYETKRSLALHIEVLLLLMLKDQQEQAEVAIAQIKDFSCSVSFSEQTEDKHFAHQPYQWTSVGLNLNTHTVRRIDLFLS